MCFTETQSYLNTIILILGALYKMKYWRLALPLFFLSLKDLLQGLLYKYNENFKINRLLTSLSWIHICFQPLFVNMFISYFAPSNKIYFSIIFIICIIYGFYRITDLNEFDIQNDDDCIDKSKTNDFCADETQSYLGKYHIVYNFSKDIAPITDVLYIILMFLPCLFTKAKYIGILWFIFVLLIRFFGGYIFKLRNGEVASMWCFLSIVFVLPLAIFSKYFKKM